MKSSDELKKRAVWLKKMAPGPALLSCDCTERCRIVHSSHNSVCPTLHFLSAHIECQKTGIMKNYFIICFRRNQKKNYYYVGNEGGDIYDDDDNDGEEA